MTLQKGNTSYWCHETILLDVSALKTQRDKSFFFLLICIYNLSILYVTLLLLQQFHFPGGHKDSSKWQRLLMTPRLSGNRGTATLCFFIASIMPSSSQNPLFCGGGWWWRTGLSRPRLKKVVFTQKRGTACSLQRNRHLPWWQNLAEIFYTISKEGHLDQWFKNFKLKPIKSINSTFCIFSWRELPSNSVCTSIK